MMYFRVFQWSDDVYEPVGGAPLGAGLPDLSLSTVLPYEIGVLRTVVRVSSCNRCEDVIGWTLIPKIYAASCLECLSISAGKLQISEKFREFFRHLSDD